MLIQLTINNFAIVHHLDIEFAQGMSVITGETGAGKSIAIDALGVCLGQRTESAMLREGQNRADICATFQIVPQSPAAEWLKSQELHDEDNPENCILRRIINADGRSKGFINSIPVSATQLKELGQLLVQVNGQHCSQRLLKNDYQLTLLDQYCASNELLADVQKQYRQWKTLQQQVNTFKQRCAENEAKKQLLQYQVEELDQFALQENEYADLEEEYHRLANSEELTNLSQSVLNTLSENDELNVDSLLYRTIQNLEELHSLDPHYEEALTMLQEALIQVQEASSEIQHLSANIEQDPYRLQEVEQRMGQALQLARKHNVKAEELVSLHQSLKQELEQLMAFTDSEEALIEQEKQAHQQLLEAAKILSLSRQKGAEKLSAQVTKGIKQLAMENAVFSIHLEASESNLTSNGMDQIQFILQANLGQSAQPLAKVASGGELSRIALVLQVLTSDKSAIPTLIFDEIDVGISGATASVVGKLLRKLGNKCQVICVTHLPQVACCGHQHFSVEKHTVAGKTETKMTALSKQQRVKALAKLLGSTKITETAIANAEEMLGLIA
ncbi:DNA repair protein RecN [Avibacterium paragallinarum]|uniref:DNA repair protein RecN n=1 Tax=Avibacterium paragallinarum TaxID=728 RepID=A0AAE5TI12_AVIPA|nr:DNA repair protein RecN [Avibacterium paragallinarum]MEE3609737.1 DNA repair protein RecN [Avibacterium paragallinarum]MEE3622012.1 DNA repair protein RecN [Avibacterium paragallinarum]MEE3669527.1 DNA repair protein RecN [Avibacterium paragallinarum]MEE3681843.1 DNA repair protein RecN [Avibacterium paragallinarum]MEE4387059.1 DNA repair protein RecN [Avibacterium paragallinarum]